ncbi:putative metal-dependent HD superfamily phosphohydrolase [Sphingobacterium allocomposti]|uniref:Putative metal-dependent HD superfamily phosphohydrolase n=1 Tax=Sphingobacterium allocomposti TaxID=415956 RepID=A0A5S5DQ34_9SPHI|nr:hypothetical protein [Sphingobacterium composti Yoo et al. 2007 non Ten et al. 2007]TYP96952.1 putative metal-dependent HD superfamily phosphohydrolase [Sphingobacterium composti Yoo et al. 2007 non Ten et al. 2007]
MNSYFAVQSSFHDLMAGLNVDEHLTDELWSEIAAAYSDSARHYHNLAHLEHMLKESSPFLQQLEAPDVFLLALFYHDIVYNPAAKDNEEASAVLAEKRLRLLGRDATVQQQTCRYIMATKTHGPTSDNDLQLFLDADLSILGQPRDVYTRYMHAVRQEYILYPDAIYRRGRINVLKALSTRPAIFQTSDFQRRYEQRARENIQAELDRLSCS